MSNEKRRMPFDDLIRAVWQLGAPGTQGDRARIAIPAPAPHTLPESTQEIGPEEEFVELHLAERYDAKTKRIVAYWEIQL